VELSSKEPFNLAPLEQLESTKTSSEIKSSSSGHLGVPAEKGGLVEEVQLELSLPEQLQTSKDVTAFFYLCEIQGH